MVQQTQAQQQAGQPGSQPGKRITTAPAAGVSAEKARRRAAEEAASTAADEIKSQSSHYSDEAMIKMVNLLYDPMTIALCQEVGIQDEAQLLSLTLISSSREAFFWADQIIKEALRCPTRTWRLSKIRRVAFLLARRSLNMKAFMLGVGLAQEQTITKGETSGDEVDI